jgi:hypothetical protein
MGSDFAVVMWVRHRFGDEKETLGYSGEEELTDVDSEAPFVGRVGTFNFSCPNVDSSQQAILQFQYRGSEQRAGFPNPQPSGGLVGLVDEEHPVSINGSNLAGGVPASPSQGGIPMWGQRLLLISPGILQENNVLRIESTQLYGTETLDDFTIDNAVVLYKTTSGDRPVVKDSLENQ